MSLSSGQEAIVASVLAAGAIGAVSFESVKRMNKTGAELGDYLTEPKYYPIYFLAMGYSFIDEEFRDEYCAVINLYITDETSNIFFNEWRPQYFDRKDDKEESFLSSAQKIEKELNRITDQHIDLVTITLFMMRDRVERFFELSSQVLEIASNQLKQFLDLIKKKDRLKELSPELVKSVESILILVANPKPPKKLH